MRIIWIKKAAAGGLLAALLLSLGGCGETAGDAAEAPEEVRTVTVNPLQQVQTTVVGLGDVNKRDIYEAVISPYVEELGFPEDGIFLEYRVKPGE